MSLRDYARFVCVFFLSNSRTYKHCTDMDVCFSCFFFKQFLTTIVVLTLDITFFSFYFRSATHFKFALFKGKKKICNFDIIKFSR